MSSLARLRTAMLVGTVRRANGVLGRRGFALVAAERGAAQGSEATSLLLGMSTDRPITIAVVGAGLAGPTSDPGVAFVRDHPRRVAQAVLVEPVPERAAALEEHLAGLGNIRVVQFAAGAAEAPALTLWQTDDWADERLRRRGGEQGDGGRAWTSGSRDHVAAHLAATLGISNARALIHVEPREVPVRPLSSILMEAGVDRLDYLQVDTEGFDDEVLFSVDLDRHRPGFIRFERIHLGPERLRRLDEHLRAAGYRQSHDSGFDRVYARSGIGDTEPVAT